MHVRQQLLVLNIMPPIRWYSSVFMDSFLVFATTSLYLSIGVCILVHEWPALQMRSCANIHRPLRLFRCNRCRSLFALMSSLSLGLAVIGLISIVVTLTFAFSFSRCILAGWCEISRLSESRELHLFALVNIFVARKRYRLLPLFSAKQSSPSKETTRGATDEQWDRFTTLNFVAKFRNGWVRPAGKQLLKL